MGHELPIHDQRKSSGAGSGSEEWQEEDEEAQPGSSPCHRGQRKLPPPNKRIDPLQVRFSQMRARTEFRDGQTLEAAMPEIKAVRLPEDDGSGATWLLQAPFPPIEVLPYQCKLRDEQGRPLLDAETGGEIWDAEDHMFTLDNRRLVCYQKAAAALWPERAVVEVIELPPQSLTRMRQVRKFRTLDSGKTVMLGSRVEDEALVRWSWREAVGLADEEHKAGADAEAGQVKMRRRPRGDPRGRRGGGGAGPESSGSFGGARGDGHGQGAGRGINMQGLLTFFLVYMAARLGKELVGAGVSSALGSAGGGEQMPTLGLRAADEVAYDGEESALLMKARLADAAPAAAASTNGSDGGRHEPPAGSSGELLDALLGQGSPAACGTAASRQALSHVAFAMS